MGECVAGGVWGLFAFTDKILTCTLLQDRQEGIFLHLACNNLHMALFGDFFVLKFALQRTLLSKALDTTLNRLRTS